MFPICRTAIFLLSVLASGVIAETAPSAPGLRLIPFPKKVTLREGNLPLRAGLVISVGKGKADRFAAQLLASEIEAWTGKSSEIEELEEEADRPRYRLTLHRKGKPAGAIPPGLPEKGGPEAYALAVRAEGMAVYARSVRGLLWGVQTARQLIRANQQEGSLAALDIVDWPSLRYRGFQDDITRGPSPHLATLQREVRLGSAFKFNFFSYYIEHQFAFTKHPEIGPKDGSLSPEELGQLVKSAGPFGVDILGNQQSFGHFYHILKHEQYRHLRETSGVLCPTIEGSYQLLDDLYSEQAPLLPFQMFNVCCDETAGLGKGPSKALAEKIGVGGVYARHMQRIHDLLKQKYHKRMMMWGDIILRHPENLEQIPKDTVMLTWGYGPAKSFEHQIIPFAKSGYEFFVCPGVNCWSRILPDFSAAVTNIRNFVRDGARHGALGMLNTTWDDDGENFFAPNWHGVLWSAECAWNASTTKFEDFNRRVGAILFGEPGDHFGQAITFLSKAHRIPGFERMSDRRFWKIDTAECPVSQAMTRAQAQQLLAIVEPALDHLLQAQAAARTNGDLLDYFIFGARRMALIGHRALGILDAALACEKGATPGMEKAASLAHIQKARTIILDLRDQHGALKADYAELWNRENKPYALDRVLGRYDRAIATYEKIIKKLESAENALNQGKPMPDSSALGLQLKELGVRNTRPARVLSEALASRTPWAVPGASHRMGLRVTSGPQATENLPVIIDLAVTPVFEGPALSLFLLDEKTGEQSPVPVQLDRLKDGGLEKIRLTFIVEGALSPKTDRSFYLYSGGSKPVKSTSVMGVTVSEARGGMKWLENGRVRLLVGPEGAHIYRWEIKAMGNLDLTQPGESDWTGFADTGGQHRHSPNRLEVLAFGPVCARMRCTDALGLEKTFTLFAGAAWVEVMLNRGTGWFWNYDATKNFAADGPNPGMFLFSNGSGGKVGEAADNQEAQVKRPNKNWSAKFRPDGLLLALLTPETKARHLVAPGAGWGGVGIESSPPATHFVIYGGKAKETPAAILNALLHAVSLREQAAITVYAMEAPAR